MQGARRFRFALGVRVRLRGGRLCPDDRGTRVIAERAWRGVGVVYWLDRPIQGLRYLHGDDLEHVRRRRG